MSKNRMFKTGVLGATGSVGQKFIQLLENHPFFRVSAVAASDRSAGKTYAEAVNWVLNTPIPAYVADMKIQPCKPPLDCDFVFSGLDASVAGEIESKFAVTGCFVISNSKNHRFDENVPLLIPEVNAHHLELLGTDETARIVTNPNCSTIGMVLALKPLHDAFGLESVNVTTMQAVSGAGFPGVASMNIIDNIIPYIPGEEVKLESEPLKILGTFDGRGIHFIDLNISAQCNRVPVTDGHVESVQVNLKTRPTKQEIIEAWRSFRAEPQKLNLPSAPQRPIHYFDEPDYPQPRLHRELERGMAIAVGGLRKCTNFDWKFTVLSHNTMRGAAGGAILCAELMIEKGIIR